MSASDQFRVEWNSLSYSVQQRKITFETPIKLKIKKTEKIILQAQSGFIHSGTLTALMGPSGAGKTTLLNCLTTRIKSGYSGSILFRNHRKGRQERDADLRIAFVPQKDHLFDQITVRETISFAIRFKNVSAKMTADERGRKIEGTARDLNLTSCLDTKVSKLSGGQAKRLSVAVEIVSTPNVLVLDEPTSGLDSTNALSVMKVIRRLLDANQGNKSAIICSIHQPSFDCLQLFDQIYLLSEKGDNFTSILQLKSQCS